MIVYRIEASTGDSFVTQWNSRLEDARKTAQSLEDAGYITPRIDRVEVGTGKESIVAALNFAHVSRSIWPGDPVK